MLRCLRMKLQKQLSRKVKDREYSKWVITIPHKQIEALGWKSGEELKAMIRDNKLVLSVKGEKNE